MKVPRLARARSLIGALALVATASMAEAQLQFTGTTMGCFTAGCTPSATAMFQNLTFTQGTFSGMAIFNPVTNQYELAIEGGAGNLGALSLGASASRTVYNVPFSLHVLFSSPNLTTSGLLYSALVSGVVDPAFPNGGGILANFDPEVMNFAFTTPGGVPGTGMLRVNDRSVNAGSVQAITGFTTANVVPEPASMALLGTGLFGMMGAARRRRRNREDMSA